MEVWKSVGIGWQNELKRSDGLMTPEVERHSCQVPSTRLHIGWLANCRSIVRASVTHAILGVPPSSPRERSACCDPQCRSAMSLVNTIDIALSTFALVSALATVLSDQGSVECCSEGWLQLVRSRCYYANTTSSVSWRQANDTCHSMNAVLAYPSNNDEQHLLQEYISTRWGYQTVHIGIYYDRYFKQWSNSDNLRSLEKPNSDKTSKGDWCSSLVPYPWNDKSEFIMQIVDCNAVKAPFICQTSKCMQCNKRPCDDYYDYLPESNIQVTQPIQKKTTVAAARQGNVVHQVSSTEVITTKNTLTTAVFSKFGTQTTFTSTTATTVSPSTANRTIVHPRLIYASLMFSFLFHQLTYHYISLYFVGMKLVHF